MRKTAIENIMKKNSQKIGSSEFGIFVFLNCYSLHINR